MLISAFSSGRTSPARISYGEIEGRKIVKRSLLASTALLSLISSPLQAQQLPTLTTPAKGDTINMSVQTGSKSSLNFGSSTSFGVTVNMNATEGTSTAVSSKLAPSEGTLLFSIGSGAVPGTTSANINNLRANGGGETNVAGSPINVTGDNANFSSGVAELAGVQGKLDLKLDSSKTGFEARTNTLHKAVMNADGTIGQPAYGTIAGQDGPQVGTGSQSATASGSASVNTSTNVDINSSSFTSVFLQAF
jgi:hypothetical protein